MFCHMRLHSPYQHLWTMRPIPRPPPWRKETKKTIFLRGKAVRNAMLPLRLSHLLSSGRISETHLILNFWLCNPKLCLPFKPKKKQKFPHYLQTNLHYSQSFSIRIKGLSWVILKKDLVLNGEPIPNSYFSEVLLSLYKWNQSMNFTGLAEFESMLRHVNSSPTLVSLKDTVTPLAHKKSKPRSFQHMSGKGVSYKHNSLSISNCPAGKKPRFLHVFRM